MAFECGCAEKGASKDSYYITTPIDYVNAAPHLGTAYSTLVCDTQARFRRMDGYDVHFLTGLDEHGQKVAESAEQHDMTPQQWCDFMAPPFQKLWRQLEVTNDDFIRTTQPRHVRAVQHFWEVLKEKGYIYKGSYEGWYCVPDETYFTEKDVRHANTDEEGNYDESATPRWSASPRRAGSSSCRPSRIRCWSSMPPTRTSSSRPRVGTRSSRSWRAA